MNNLVLNNIKTIDYERLGKIATVSSEKLDMQKMEQAVAAGVSKAIKKILISHITMDKKGFKKYILKGDSTTEILNNMFPI